MRHHILAAGMGLLLVTLGACAANHSASDGIAPSRKAAKALDDSQYYAPSEPREKQDPAVAEEAKAIPAGYVEPGQDRAAPAVDHVPLESAAPGERAKPIVPAFPAKMEQDRLRDMKTVFFLFDQADLTDDAKRELQANAAWLKAHPSVRVRVEGHCDERGTSEYNLGLGARRANQVRDYLVHLGVSAYVLDPISFGEEMPLKAGHDESAWRWNRRVEFSPAQAAKRAAAQTSAAGEPRM